MLVYLVAGARPNFMKIAPIVRALQAREELSSDDNAKRGSEFSSKLGVKLSIKLDFKIIHTGQHYDHDMNAVLSLIHI